MSKEQVCAQRSPVWIPCCYARDAFKILVCQTKLLLCLSQGNQSVNRMSAGTDKAKIGFEKAIIRSRSFPTTHTAILEPGVVVVSRSYCCFFSILFGLFF